MSKYVKYYLGLFFGGALCFLLFVNLANVPLWASILIDIISVLAGGVFGSMLVTIIVEKVNDKNKQEKLISQKDILLSDIKICVRQAVFNELRNMNMALAIYFNRRQKSARKKQKYLFKDAIEELKKYYELLMINTQTKVNLFGPDELQQKEQFDRCFYKNTRGYFQNLRLYIEKIIINKEYHMINEVLSEEDIECLYSLLSVVSELSEFLKNEAFELALEYKSMFYDEVIKFSDHFKLTEKYNSSNNEMSLYEINKESLI